MRWRALITLGCSLLTGPSTLSAQGHWLLLAQPTSQGLNRIAFLDSMNGWVAGNNGALFRTTDSGVSWSAQHTPVHADIVDLHMLNNRLGWAVSYYLPGDTVFSFGTYLLRTTNGGNLWTARHFPGEIYYAISFTDSLNGWMGGEFSRILGTTDGGDSWVDARADTLMFSDIPVTRVRMYSRSRGFALGGMYDIFGVIWRTSDAGAHWSVMQVAPEPVHDLMFFDSLHAVAVAGDYEFGPSFLRTTDGGEQWEYRYLGFLGIPRSLSMRTQAEWWVALGSTGTFLHTDDGGTDWSVLYAPDSIGVHDIAFPDSLHGYMIAADGRIFRHTTSPQSAAERAVWPVPEGVALAQNYPNPFNPETSFEFRVASSGFVTLRVYDLLGREVATLLNEVMQPGTYTVQWNARGLPSGVYFYRLSSGDQARVGRMCLAR